MNQAVRRVQIALAERDFSKAADAIDCALEVRKEFAKILKEGGLDTDEPDH